MKITVHRPALALALISVCAGCNVLPEKPTPTPAPDQDQVLVMLNRSARSIERSLVQLAEAEQYEKLKVRPGEQRSFKQIPGMEASVLIPWPGAQVPLEQAVKALADAAHFNVKYFGRTPVLPIIVQVSRESASISDHLRNIGIQAGSRADIVVDPKSRVVEVRYANGV